MDWHIQNYLFTIVFSIFVIWYLNLIWKKGKLYYHSWSVPGPFSFPIIGIGYLFLGNQTEFLDKIIKLISKYPSPMKAWLGPKLIYPIKEPEHLEKLLTNQKCLHKEESFYKFLGYLGGNGLIPAPVSIWRKHRKLIQPSFNQKVLDGFVDIFSEQSVIFADTIKEYVGKKDININKNVAAFSMDVLCESGMGLELNAQKSENSFAEHFEILMEITNIRIFHIWHHLDWTWKFFPLSKEYEKHLEALNSTAATVINKKLATLNQVNTQREDSITDRIEEGGRKERLAFLDLILEHGFTEQELMDEVKVFLMAGTDTIATTLDFLFEVLGIYQDVQQKIYEEVIDILGEERNVEASDLTNFRYLERVIKESMRLFPAAPLIFRRVGEDIKLGQFTIPEDATLLISILNIHKDPRYWPDPLKFDPDRFLPEEVSKRPSCSYIPFSFGPRNCIGLKYAMMVMKTIIATTIRKYRIFSGYKSAAEIELQVKTVLRRKNPSRMYIEHR